MKCQCDIVHEAHQGVMFGRTNGDGHEGRPCRRKAEVQVICTAFGKGDATIVCGRCAVAHDMADCGEIVSTKEVPS